MTLSYTPFNELECIDSIDLIGVVTSVVVDPINTELERRPLSHEVKKPFKSFSVRVIFVPFRADVDPSSSIVLESNVARIVAPNMHHSPDTIFPRIFSDNRLLLAPAIFLGCMRSEDVILWNLFGLTTYAQCKYVKPLITGSTTIVRQPTQDSPIIDSLP